MLRLWAGSAWPRLTKIGLGSLSLAQADLALADLVCLG